MDTALEIHDYLPLSYKTESEGAYIRFLWESFESNYTNGKYQFAMLAFHMLYMSYVYFSVWQIKLSRPQDFCNAVIFQQKERELLDATSPFTFSEVNERSIFKFLRLIGCGQQHIGQFQKLVDQRNEIAHPNRNIFFSDQASADRKIEEILGQLGAIQGHMAPALHHCLSHFLLGSADPEQREYPSPEDQVRETLIHSHYFSRRDVEACLQFDISAHQGHPQFGEMQRLFAALRMSASE